LVRNHGIETARNAERLSRVFSRNHPVAHSLGVILAFLEKTALGFDHRWGIVSIVSRIKAARADQVGQEPNFPRTARARNVLKKQELTTGASVSFHLAGKGACVIYTSIFADIWQNSCHVLMIKLAH
jgi:hypothetical protein